MPNGCSASAAEAPSTRNGGPRPCRGRASRARRPPGKGPMPGLQPENPPGRRRLPGPLPPPPPPPGPGPRTPAEADVYADRCRGALEQLAHQAPGWPERPVLEHDSSGALARVNVSVKISALTPLLRADAPAIGERDAAERLRPLLRRAQELGAHVHIDMESLDSREAVLELVLKLLAEPEFESGPSAGIVLQAYLRDSPQQ